MAQWGRWIRGVCLGSGLAAAVAAPLAARPAIADTEIGPVVVTGEIEAGLRLHWLNGDDSVFDRYRDLSNGPTGNFDLLVEDTDRHWFLRGTGWNLGYDNQRYTLEGGRYGRWKLDGFYGQLPVVYSNDARTLYTRSGNQALLLPSALQTQLQGLAGTPAQSQALANALLGATAVDLEYTWQRGGAGGEYHVRDDLLLRANYEVNDKRGTRPFAMQWGSPGGTFVSLPAPVKERIHEVRAGADFARDWWSFSFDYVGSIFENDLDSVFASNPLVANNAAGQVTGQGSVVGRTAYTPDNQAHQFMLSGSAALPIGFHNRLSTSFAYQVRTQNDEFLPLTTNGALAIQTPALSRSSLDGRVDTILGNVLWTGRPLENLNLKVRYRIYDFENKTASVATLQHVVNDTSLSNTPITSVHSDYLRQNADVLASYQAPFGLTPALGFEWESYRRSRDREVRNLDEYGPTAKLDWRLAERALIQATYTYRHREGNGYDTFSTLVEQLGSPQATIDAAVQQSILVRKYDLADRDANTVKLLARVTPTETSEITFSGGYTGNDYSHTSLGLTHSSLWNVGADGGWQVHDRVHLGGYFTYENGTWEQDQQWRPRSFFVAGPGGANLCPPQCNQLNSAFPGYYAFPSSAANNWFSQTKDQYYTGGVRVGMEFVPGRLDGDIGWVISYGRSKTDANGVAGATLVPPPTTAGDGGNAVNWPTITNVLNALTATLNWHVSENVTLRGQYRFEDYRTDDFTQPTAPYLPLSNVNGSGAVTPSLDVWLGQGVGDYTANILALSVILEF